MNKNEIVKKVLSKLKEMKEDLEKELDGESEEQKIAAILDQNMLDNFVLNLKTLEDPEEVKKLVKQFDYVNNKEKKQAPRLELLNKLKKEGFFKFDETSVEMQRMWHRLVVQEWKIPYKFES